MTTSDHTAILEDIIINHANLDDIHNVHPQITDRVDNEGSIYDKLYHDILESEQTKDDKIAALEQLNKDMDYDELICLRNDIPFYIDDADIEIIEEIGDKTTLIFASGNEDFYVDFMMTADNDDTTYKKRYSWDDDKDEPLPYSAEYPDELDEYDRFTFDTASYFHIGDANPYRNNIDYVTKFHRSLEFNHILTNLQCEVAASFATQSNHNLIGRTNETYIPIKYYKLNDNDDKFWIELYDRNEIDVPVSFEDFFIFTMDVVFLQNRKLLYT